MTNQNISLKWFSKINIFKLILWDGESTLPVKKTLKLSNTESSWVKDLLTKTLREINLWSLKLNRTHSHVLIIFKLFIDKFKFKNTDKFFDSSFKYFKNIHSENFGKKYKLFFYQNTPILKLMVKISQVFNEIFDKNTYILKLVIKISWVFIKKFEIFVIVPKFLVKIYKSNNFNYKFQNFWYIF